MGAHRALKEETHGNLITSRTAPRHRQLLEELDEICCSDSGRMETNGASEANSSSVDGSSSDVSCATKRALVDSSGSDQISSSENPQPSGIDQPLQPSKEASLKLEEPPEATRKVEQQSQEQQMYPKQMQEQQQQQQPQQQQVETPQHNRVLPAEFTWREPVENTRRYASQEQLQSQLQSQQRNGRSFVKMPPAGGPALNSETVSAPVCSAVANSISLLITQLQRMFWCSCISSQAD